MTYQPLYLKVVLSILKKIEFKLAKRGDYYFIDSIPFDEIVEDDEECNSLMLESFDAFFDINNLYLINCGFYIRDHDLPIFIFRMGIGKCDIIFTGNDLISEDLIKFRNVLPEDIEDESWIDILSVFIKSINYIINNNLRIEYTPNVN